MNSIKWIHFKLDKSWKIERKHELPTPEVKGKALLEILH